MVFRCMEVLVFISSAPLLVELSVYLLVFIIFLNLRAVFRNLNGS